MGKLDIEDVGATKINRKENNPRSFKLEYELESDLNLSENGQFHGSNNSINGKYG